VAEQLFRKQQVIGSNPIVGFPSVRTHMMKPSRDDRPVVIDRSLRLVVDGDRLTMRPPRLGPAMVLGLLLGLLVAAYGIANAIYPARPHPIPGAAKRGNTAPIAKPWEFERLHQTPLGTSGDDAPPKPAEPLAIQVLRAPWAPVPCGLLVFYVVSLLFRNRIVLDRSRNLVSQRNRAVCALTDVIAVEVNNTPRVQVMNGMSLILKDGERLPILLYNGRAGARIRAGAATIAEFVDVPVRVTVDKIGFGRKTQ
jgi:hypothetical protein